MDKNCDLCRDIFTVKEGAPLPVGVSKTNNGVNFSVFLPRNKECNLLIYKRGERIPCEKVLYKEGKRVGALWTVQLTDFKWEKFEYNFEVEGKIFHDNYGKCFVGKEKFGVISEFETERNSLRCSFAFEKYDWEKDELPNIPMNEVIAYNLHVRGFTKHSSSEVKYKGSFLGIIEKIPYLKELGINQIELMPAYEFDEFASLNDSHIKCPKKINYWGYGPAFYFAPKASYSAKGNPCIEFKDMVKACHKAGIEVVMEFYFPTGINGHLIFDCIRYWAIEYHIDGFHLNGEDVPLDEVATDPVLANVKIYSTSFSTKAISGNERKLATYQDYFTKVSRKLLRGDEDQLRSFAYATTRYTEKTGVINYITSHNGFTLHDLVSYDKKHNEANGENNCDGNSYNFSWNCGEEGITKKSAICELRIRQMKNAMAMLYLSQGIPMLLAGDEMGNSQDGNNNAYCHDGDISWIQWNQSLYREVKSFIKKLIALRKMHPVLWKEERAPMMNIRGCGFPKVSFHGNKAWDTKMDVWERHLGIMYCNKTKTKDGKSIFDILYVAYNFQQLGQGFELPKLPNDMEWCKLLDTGGFEEKNVINIEEGEVLANQQMIIVPERTVVVLAGKEYENK